MKKIANQMLYNLKKEKSSFISLGIVILITALILNCAVVLLHQFDRSYDEKFEKFSTAELNVIISEEQSNIELKNTIGEIEKVEKYESHKLLLTEASVKNFNGADFSMNIVFYSIDDNRTINNFEIVSESKNIVDNPIYIPLYISKFGGFSVGDEIIYVIDNKPHSFTVAGVFEEMQYGNYGSALICNYMPNAEFNKLSDILENETFTEYSMLLNDEKDIEKVKETIENTFESRNVMLISILDSKGVKGTRTMVCDLLILILTTFALIILVVSVFLSIFKIKNSIDAEIVNMSVLKAIGYTSSQIIASITLPYAIVSLLFSVFGVGLSYLILPFLCSVLTVQSGFSFAINFDFVSLMCVIIILSVVVTFFTFVSARKIRKIQPVDGLRGNIVSNKLKKNYLSLEETKGNIKILLVLKQMIISKKQNIMIFIVSFVLTVLVAFSSTLFYNVAVKPDNFMSALSDEMSDVIIYPNSDNVIQLETLLNNDNRIEKSLQYMSGSVKIEKKTVTAFASEDFSKVRNDVCYIGKNPDKSDEIALGSAYEGKYKIDDIISVTVSDITKDFRITGFVQSVNLQGELCEFSIEGYQSLFNEKQTLQIYVYLKNPIDAEMITEEYKTNHPDLVLDSVNSYKLQKEAQDMYMGITVVFVVVIFVITILVMIFILYIVIKSLLVKRKQELGIYKALGYTSSQLILQTSGSFLPISITAILLSSVSALFYMNGIYQFIFEALGIMKNNIEISFGFLMLFAAVQILANIIISIILCIPIRKISAYTLIKE